MSSRSLAAARARRSGENVPPVSGNRPVTSIGSHAAFQPQQTQQSHQSHQQFPPNNVRISKSGQPPQRNNNYQPPPPPPQNGLPFSKLSVSDAIGLITLRLGRVEQWVIETEHEKEANENNTVSGLPENSKVIDISILTNIISRLDTIENSPQNISSDGNLHYNIEEFGKLSEDVQKLTEQITRIGDETTKHTLTISKHTEQLFRFEREFVETKDILKTFMLKYDNFVKEITDKFTDYECALTELEKNVSVDQESEETNTCDEEVVNNELENHNEKDPEGEGELETPVINSNLKSEIERVFFSNN